MNLDTMRKQILQAAEIGATVAVELHGMDEGKVVEIVATPSTFWGECHNTHFSLVVMGSGHIYQAVSFLQVKSVRIIQGSELDISETWNALVQDEVLYGEEFSYEEYLEIISQPAVARVLELRVKNTERFQQYIESKRDPNVPRPKPRIELPLMPHLRYPEAQVH